MVRKQHAGEPARKQAACRPRSSSANTGRVSRCLDRYGAVSLPRARGSMNDNTEQVLTISELMRRWKCARKSVCEAIHRGDLRAFRIGKGRNAAYRVTLAEVERYENTKG